MDRPRPRRQLKQLQPRNFQWSCRLSEVEITAIRDVAERNHISQGNCIRRWKPPEIVTMHEKFNKRRP